MGKGFVTNWIVLLLALAGFVALIFIFPERICLPFSDVCFFFQALHDLKLFLIILGFLFFGYGYILAILFLLFNGIRTIKKNRIIRDVIKFLVTFDEQTYKRLMKNFQ